MGYDEFRAQHDKIQPLGRIGKPDDVAYAILYLASDESTFMTASELVIDGGGIWRTAH
ncbi:MAG: SDR family oxidoreductase [Legionellales bacterium]|nr:SDR family oxidoreductase [Legionellales bacterium]